MWSKVGPPELTIYLYWRLARFTSSWKILIPPPQIPLDPLIPLLWLYDLFIYVKGVLEAFTLKDLASCGCSEDEKVENFAVDDGDVEVIVRWNKMEDVGERGGG